MSQELARQKVSSHLLPPDDAETQSRIRHPGSEGRGWQPKEEASPLPAATREGSLVGIHHRTGGAGAEWLHPAQKKKWFPARCSHCLSFALGWNPRCCSLDQMDTLLHPDSGTEMGFSRAGRKE